MRFYQTNKIAQKLARKQLASLGDIKIADNCNIFERHQTVLNDNQKCEKSG